jgi:tight adherence protein C
MSSLVSALTLGVQGNDLFFLVTAIAGLAIMVTVGRSFVYHNKFATRVKALQERRTQLKSQLMTPRKRTRKTGPAAGVGFMRDIVSKLNLLQKSQVGKISHLLVNAGYRSKDAIFVFTFFQLVCPIVALAVALAVAKINFAAPFVPKWKPLFVVGMAYLGFKLPGVMVINTRTKRYYAIQKSLSDTLDLMMICAEAGLSLASSLDRVAKELGATYPEMSEELSLTSIEIGFLPDRKRALTNLAERVDMPEIRGITGVLIQTEKYGTPIAQALRVLAAEFRTQRMLRAEQKAARLPAIMTVPMIIFILPTLFIVVLAPAMIKLADTWK